MTITTVITITDLGVTDMATVGDTTHTGIRIIQNITGVMDIIIEIGITTITHLTTQEDIITDITHLIITTITMEILVEATIMEEDIL